MQLWHFLRAYWQTKRAQHWSRAQLEAYQQKSLSCFLQQLCRKSPYFQEYQDKPLAAFPTMNKSLMLSHFDQMNTASLTLDQVLQTALQAEQQRDFHQTLGGYTVGLSSGTTGQRGVFAVSPKEQAIWAGVMVAKALPNGLLQKTKVALFLRSSSTLYETLTLGRISFDYFDLFQPLEKHIALLQAQPPDILLAPTQVLVQLAQWQSAGRIKITPKKVFAIAEVLTESDQQFLQTVWGRIDQIYQATEGFLAISCPENTLHWNEDRVLLEPEWLDADHFVPIITDLTRMTQPIVRYRLDDVLQKKKERCPCGRVSFAIERIDGRCDDTWQLYNQEGRLQTVFADVLHRALAQVLPVDVDYRFEQRGSAEICLEAALTEEQQSKTQAHIFQVLLQLGIDTHSLVWQHIAQTPIWSFHQKRRRIVRRGQ